MILKFKAISEMADWNLGGGPFVPSEHKKKFEEIDKEDSTLQSHHNYSTQQHDAIIRYSGPSYIKINRELYNGSPISKENKGTHKLLREAISQNKTPMDLTVHTGVKKSPEHHENPDSDHIKVHLPAFTSTSLDFHTAKGFSKGDEDSKHKRGTEPYKHVVSIKVPKGSHAAYLQGKSMMNEHELLLHPGAKIHIHKTPNIDHERRTVQWKAHLVHDGIKETE